MRPDEFFFRLTPDRVLSAVEAAGFEPTGHCFPLNALENRVYDVRVRDRASDREQHMVAKFYRPGRWERAAIEEEHALLFLLAQREIPVCAPIRFADGESLHEVAGIYYGLWPRTGGRPPDELSDDDLAQLGRLLARIHATAESLALRHRRTVDSRTAAREPLEFLEKGGFLAPSIAKRYARTVLEIAALYDDWSQGVALHPIHGDCHPGNLLRGDSGFFFLDFDDLAIGPAVHDVWMLVPGRDSEADRQRELLVRAYRQFRAFDEREMRLVEPLRAFRFVSYCAWIAKRWEDPAFPDAFPHFGSEQYWEDEARDLEEQLERIHGGSGAGDADGATTAGESDRSGDRELTNKDFFWDL
jgi:Ser/Thr protein kinase RdoA (MazF antagonist)